MKINIPLLLLSLVIGVPSFLLCAFVVLDAIYSTGITNDNGAVATIPLYSGTGYKYPPSEWRLYKYEEENNLDISNYYAMAKKHGPLSGFIPNAFLNDKCFQYSFNGIETRKEIYKNILKYSKEVGVDPDLVISAIIGEQIRIACSSKRAGVKSVVMNTTPRRLVSFDFSLGVGGVKPSTAEYIRRHSKYGKMLSSFALTEEQMTTNNTLMALLPVLLVEHISKTWKTVDPGIIGTVYNLGVELKKPHSNPRVGGAIIKVGGYNVTYGELSAFVHLHRKIYR